MEIPYNAPQGGDRSLRVTFTDSLRNVLSTTVPEAAKTTGEWTLPPVATLVAEARKTIKGPTVPSQTPADRARVRHLRSLRDKVKETEAELAATVKAAEDKSAAKLDAYRKFGENANLYEEALTELSEIKEEGVQMYLKKVAERNVELAQLKHENMLRQSHEQTYAAENFAWHKYMRRLFPLLHDATFSEDSGWRAELRATIAELEETSRMDVGEGGMGLPFNPEATGEVHSDNCEAEYVPGSDIPLIMRRFMRDVNKFTARQMEVRLRELEGILLDHEARLSKVFETIRANSKDTASRLRDAKSRWRPSGVPAAPGAGDTPAELAHRLVDDRREASVAKLREARANLPAPPTPAGHRDAEGDVALARMLAEAGRMADVLVGRGEEARVAMSFHHCMVFAAGRGNWRGALQAYRAMSSRKLPSTFPTTFQTLLLAAKNCQPQSASFMVLPIMEEAEACGFALTREVYHSAMDVCRVAGHWRQALALFNRMTAGGIDPTTQTYALLQQAGALANNTEPAMVYSAMTYAGVPAYLSYTAASARAMNRTGTDEGPISDWLGATVLPPANANATARAALLASGKAATFGSLESIYSNGAIYRTPRGPDSSTLRTAARQPVPRSPIAGIRGAAGASGKRRARLGGTEGAVTRTVSASAAPAALP